MNLINMQLFNSVKVYEMAAQQHQTNTSVTVIETVVCYLVFGIIIY